MTREFPLRGASRREFVQAVMTASAVLGLGPTRAFEVLEEMGGSALANPRRFRAARSTSSPAPAVSPGSTSCGRHRRSSRSSARTSRTTARAARR